jgi:catechol 2,3-dioxygenase-like lactoylglutathione lyase family enzyme
MKNYKPFSYKFNQAYRASFLILSFTLHSMQDQLSIIIKALQHVGIPVTDLAVSEAFYKRLGFEKVMQAPFEMDGETGRCIMMKKGSILLELYLMPEMHLQEIRKRKDGRIDHIAFDVANIDSAFATLKTAGFTIMEEAPVFLSFWRNGCRYFNVLGPDGERLEFNQIL